MALAALAERERRAGRVGHVGDPEPRSAVHLRGPAASARARDARRSAGHRRRARARSSRSGTRSSPSSSKRASSSGEIVDARTFDRVSLEAADELESFIDRFEDEIGPDFRDELRRSGERRGTSVNVGRIWERPFDEPPTLLVGRRRELVEIVVAALEQSPPRSVLLVGEHGVGKTALARAALDRIDDDADRLRDDRRADQRRRDLHRRAGGSREDARRLGRRASTSSGSLPELQEALFAGQHSRSPQGLLDALLPHIESGRDHARRGGDAGSGGAARLPAAAREERVRDRARATARRRRHDRGRQAAPSNTTRSSVETDDETLAEALELAQQFLPSVAQPGNLLRLLHATAAEAAEQEDAELRRAPTFSRRSRPAPDCRSRCSTRRPRFRSRA